MDRVLTSTTAQLFVQFSSDEAAVDTDNQTATVTVTGIDGAAIAADAATTRISAGYFRYNLPAQTRPQPLTLSWKGTIGGTVTTVRTHAEVVGSRAFSIAEARASDNILADSSKFTRAQVEQARAQVEDEFQRILSRSLIVRGGATKTTGDGTSLLRVDHLGISQIRAVSIDGIALGSTDLADLRLRGMGNIIERRSSVWTCDADVVIYYDYGGFVEETSLAAVEPQLPEDLKEAALLRLRSKLVKSNSGIPDRATSMQLPEGGSFQLATAGRRGFSTGIPDVDAVLDRYNDTALAGFA